MRRCLILAIIILGGLMLALPVSHAQSPSPVWEVVLLDHGSDQLVRLTPGGVAESRNLPRQAPESPYSSALLSPNRQYLVLLEHTDGGVSLMVANLATQSCCVTVPSPIGNSLEGYWMGFFSPNSTQFVMGFAGSQTTGQTFKQLGGLMIVNAADGSIAAQLNAEAYSSATLTPAGWTDQGILFYPNCWGCEPAYDGFYNLWNPVTNTTQITTTYFNNFFGDRLAGTGEFLYTRDRVDYPADPNAAGFFPPANVVEYYPLGQPSTADASGQVVYFNPNNLNLPTAHWVANGQAMVMVNVDTGLAEVVTRRGGQFQVNTLPQPDWVLGTPDGWLVAKGGAIQHFIYQNEQVTSRSLATLTGPLQILEKPRLGDGVTPGMSVTVPPPQAVTCPGFLPSRLRVGRMAQVTPGTPNNLRNGPGLNFQKIGEIPGNGVILVRSGPQCADNMAWWEVDYQGKIGWTSEGTGNSYWIQPMANG
jgi:hypothetical protein